MVRKKWWVSDGVKVLGYPFFFFDRMPILGKGRQNQLEYGGNMTVIIAVYDVQRSLAMNIYIGLPSFGRLPFP
jgi:hypothetical protein